MNRLTVIFPSDDPVAGRVCHEYESEYLGCVSSECFDVALYNESGYLHGDPLVIAPPAPSKRVYCLLRGRPMSDRAYVKLAKDLKHFGYATITSVDSAWSAGYYMDDPYSLRDYRPMSVKPYRLGNVSRHYSPSVFVFNKLGPFIVRDAASVWMEDGRPKVFTPPITQDELDNIVDTFKETIGVNHATWSSFDSVKFEKVEQYWQNDGVSAEWRAFYFDGRLLCMGLLHPGDDDAVPRPPDELQKIASRYAKPYTSIDFAMTESGSWRVTRFFDAQFTDLPLTMDPRRYYETLAAYVDEAPMVSEWAWCLVGEIVDENVIGEEHRVVHGTRHFAPGTKVYCACELGGNGWERICVLGIPRYSDNLISMIVPATKIRNFRLEKVYDRRIIEVMTNGWLGGAFCSINPAQIGFGWSDSDQDRKDIESLVESFKVWPWITGEKA